MLNRLKLTAIRDQLDSLIDEAGRRELTIREALSPFCEREIARKDERRIEMSVGLARFPFERDLDGFDFAAQPSIDKKQIRELTAGRFIANAVGEALRRDCTPTVSSGGDGVTSLGYGVHRARYPTAVA
jgi:DNA replication protein DnaC